MLPLQLKDISTEILLILSRLPDVTKKHSDIIYKKMQIKCHILGRLPVDIHWTSPPSYIGVGAGQVGPVLTGPLFRKKLVGVTIITINTCVLVRAAACSTSG